MSTTTSERQAPSQTAEAPSSTATTEGLRPNPRDGAVALWCRRLFVLLLLAIIVTGLVGLFGVHARTVTARSADGRVEISVHYAQVARAGLAVPFTVTIRRDGGFSGDVRLAVSSSYLDLFDRNAIDPEPDSSTATEDDQLWVFTAPPGDALEIALDMSVQSGRHWGRSGTVSVLDEHGQPIVSTTFKTWLAP